VVVEIDVDEVERRVDAGDTVNAIAAGLGVSSRTIRNRLRAAGRLTARERRQQAARQRLHDEAWLRDQYLAQGVAANVIATACHATTAEVNEALIRFQIARPPTHPELQPDALRQSSTAGGSVKAIARTLGVERKTVRRAMRSAGIHNPRALGPRPKQLDDPEWLTTEYVLKSRSMAAMATELNCAADTVRRALIRTDTPLRTAGEVRLYLDPAWLRHHVDQGWSLAKIAAAAGCGASTIKRRAAELGITRQRPTRTPRARSGRISPHYDMPGGLDRQWLEQRYVRQHRTIRQIGSEAGVSSTTVQRAIYHHGLRSASRRHTVAALDDRDWLQQRYIGDGASAAEIGLPLGTPAGAVRSALRRHGIRRRPA